MEWIYYGIVVVLITMATILMAKLRKKFIAEVATILYQKQDGEAYLKQLQGWKAKIFIDRKMRMFMMVDGYLLNNELQAVTSLFQELELTRLSITKKIGLYKKEVEVYVDAGFGEKAIKANATLQQLCSEIKNEELQRMAEEMDDLVEININHNGDLAEKMVSKGKQITSKVGKSIYYYRAAKCYYFKGNDVTSLKYLEKAKQNSGQSLLSKHIEECLKDQSLFYAK
ncbi:MAG: hypothetical protein ACRCZJ_05755 [Erysipelotrichaceae bacterium]